MSQCRGSTFPPVPYLVRCRLMRYRDSYASNQTCHLSHCSKLRNTALRIARSHIISRCRTLGQVLVLEQVLEQVLERVEGGTFCSWRRV